MEDYDFDRMIDEYSHTEFSKMFLYFGLYFVFPADYDKERYYGCYGKADCRNGVDMHFCFEATADAIIGLDPDVVILATGAKPIVPNFENDGIDVVTAFDVLTGKEPVDENNLIVGGGMVGLETALYTVSQMRRATVVEMGAEAGSDMFISTKIFTDKELREGNVDVLTETKVVKLTKDGAVCQGADGEFVLSGFDRVIMAIGSSAVNTLEAELKGKIDGVHVIGDAVKPRRIWCAIEEAAKLAVSL